MHSWVIKPSSGICFSSGRSFGKGEIFYTLLVENNEAYERRDFSLEAWKKENENEISWQSVYFPPEKKKSQEILDPEEKLKSFLTNQDKEEQKIAFLFALLLERKKLLKYIGEKKISQGRVRIYETPKRKEVLMIPYWEVSLAEAKIIAPHLSQLLRQSLEK